MVLAVDKSPSLDRYARCLIGYRLSHMSKPNETIVTAEVIEALPNAMFRVVFQDGTQSIAYLSGKMKLHRIKVLVGDTVHIVTDPYGGKGRIVKRS